MEDPDLSRSIVFSKIKSCSFALYSSSELRSLSVKQITLPVTFDQLGEPIDDGLYDPSLGPNRPFENCKTCKQSSINCPGHIGHIELDFAVFNPVTFGGLLKILKLICFFCGKWKCEDKTIHLLQIRLQLILKNDIAIAMGLNEKDLQEDKFENFLSDQSDSEPTRKFNQKDIFKAKRSVIEAFLNQPFAKTCRNCNCINPSFLKEGVNKLFVKEININDMSKNMKVLQNRPYPMMLERNQTREVLPFEIHKTLSDFWEVNKHRIPPLFNSTHENGQGDLKYTPNNFSPGMNFDVFFVETVAVSPSKFRPSNRVGDTMVENEKTECLARILTINSEMIKIAENSQNGLSDENSESPGDNRIKRELAKTKMESWSISKVKGNLKSALLAAWSKLQYEYSMLYSSDNSNFGLKQLLEKKDGILRSNLMGKRVNYSARSIVSPDMWIESTEIGVPKVFAKTLTFPEPVNNLNIDFLRKSVINGPEKYPGANFVENQFGWIIDLTSRTKEQRVAIAKSLEIAPVDAKANRTTSSCNRKRVHRHIRNGDFVLMNRQPTLHKASMMGHRVKVLNCDHSVLRMHYTNCNTYNADFDGDEINLHLPQNYVSRTECELITATCEQYLSPKDASPLRGLVQDHVCAAVLMTMRDSFFSRFDYMRYVFLTLSQRDLSLCKRTKTVSPCILKPKRLWTGKQILSTLLWHVSGEKAPLNLDSKSQVPPDCLSEYGEDPFMTTVTIHRNEWLTGICDKAQIGAKRNGIIAAVHELYGPSACDALLTKFGKLFTTYLQNKGLTAGPSDLILEKDAERTRRKCNKLAKKGSQKVGGEFTGLAGRKLNHSESSRVARAKLSKTNGEEELDSKMKNFLNPLSSKISGRVLPHGMETKFPHNNFALMVLSGGKGSRVNISQICALLGQQELEGKRVPRTLAGKTLPSFRAFDLGAEAGGFISDRFLTGINPQVYFFHCMAGREGLVDTAVKTSRSGYLQRCIVKNLENVQVCYDQTVRESNGDVIQFNYGEDGIDPVKSAYLFDFEFIEKNSQRYAQRKHDLGALLDEDSALDYVERQKRSAVEDGEGVMDPVMSRLSSTNCLGSVSERFQRRMEDFLCKKRFGASCAVPRLKSQVEEFRDCLLRKYLVSQVDPGESVGIIAGQSIGEPSTQMTLNTFHLAGHGGANVTLGIPRLREILMTGSSNIRTPTMEFGFAGNINARKAAKKMSRRLKTIYFNSIIKRVKCNENQTKKTRKFNVEIELNEFDQKISWSRLKKSVSNGFVPLLAKELHESIVFLPKNKTESNRSEEQNDSPAETITPPQAKKALGFFEDKEGLSSGGENDSFPSGESNSEDASESEEITTKESTRRLNANSHKTRKTVEGLEKHFAKLKFAKKKISFALRLPAELSQKINLLQIVRKASGRLKLRNVPGIKNCYVVERRNGGETETKVQTDGVNFEALFREDCVDVNTIESNDVAAVLRCYGVEACRRVIIEQIETVFGAYGISVDRRHLSLVSESMTWEGNYSAFNRRDLARCDSPLLKMSFESGLSVLRRACETGERDDVVGHSAKLVMGQVIQSGTGSFDLLHSLRGIK